MRFKLDENLPVELAEELRHRGHEADTVNDENLSGAPDPTVVAAAAAESRVLLTLDKGIANLVQYPEHAGVVLFRPSSAGRKAVAAFIRERLDALLAADLTKRVTVVGQHRIRLR